MKLAWLVQDEDDGSWDIFFAEPPSWKTAIRIVYQVVEEGPPT